MSRPVHLTSRVRLPYDPLEINLDQVPVEVVPIAALIAGDSPRLSGQDEEHTKTLAQTEDRLTPILVHRPTMRIIDGMHRVEAARLRGEREIEVRFFDGDTAAAFVLAVKANVSHGLPLTLADRSEAAARILNYYPGWSDRAIARATGLAAPTIASIRKRTTPESGQSDVRLGSDGRMRPLNTAEGRRLAGELIGKHPDAPLRDIAKKAGVSPSTVRDVRKRLANGDDPVPHRQRVSKGSRQMVWPRLARPNQARRPADIVSRLQKDPSLRSSEGGRTLLKWLSLDSACAERWPEFLDCLPPHCILAVLEAARGLAKVWSDLADELERRAKVDSGQ